MVLITCKIAYGLSYQDYIHIKYMFPDRAIFRMISILMNYLYMKEVFLCIEYYIEINTFLIIRIGRKAVNILLLKRVIKFVVIFLLYLVLIDFVLYQRSSIFGILITVAIAMLISVLMIVLHTKFRNKVFIVSLILCLLIKYGLSLLMGIKI